MASKARKSNQERGCWIRLLGRSRIFRVHFIHNSELDLLFGLRDVFMKPDCSSLCIG